MRPPPMHVMPLLGHPLARSAYEDDACLLTPAPGRSEAVRLSRWLVSRLGSFRMHSPLTRRRLSSHPVAWLPWGGGDAVFAWSAMLCATVVAHNAPLHLARMPQGRVSFAAIAHGRDVAQCDPARPQCPRRAFEAGAAKAPFQRH